MEPSTAENLQPLCVAKRIQADVKSLRSLNALKSGHPVLFDGHTYSFSKDEKRLHLYLVGSKEIQELQYSSAKSALSNLQHMYEKIHADLKAVKLCLKQKDFKDDSSGAKLLAETISQLYKELKSASCTSEGLHTLKFGLEKYGESKQEVDKSFEVLGKLCRSAKKLDDNLSVILEYDPFQHTVDQIVKMFESLELSSENIEKALRAIPESAPRVPKSHLSTPSQSNPPQIYKENTHASKPVTKDPFDNEELFKYFDLPSDRKQGHLKVSAQHPEKKALPRSQPRQNTNNTVPTILPQGYLDLRVVRCWKVLSDRFGRRFCIIRVSRAAFVRIPIEGELRESLEIIKKKYNLRDSDQIVNKR